MKLNLGCGDKLLYDYLNVDKEEPEFTEHTYDYVFEKVNLEKTFPWKDNSIDYILAEDIIEHLPDKIHTMNEIFRILKPEGKVRIIVPSTDGRAAFQDPTHVSFWNRNSFFYFEKGNIYRDRFAKNYGIIAEFKIFGEMEINSIDGPKIDILLEK